jgi:predicted ArsR family transcriptional regulator
MQSSSSKSEQRMADRSATPVPAVQREAWADAHWTFLTNHAHVLLCLAADPGARVRDVAEQVGITERATLRILHDLVADGYVKAERVGRRNRYRLHLDEPMRHPMERGRRIGALVDALGERPA